VSAVASISSQVRSGSWAAGAPGYSASQADCASIPGIAGMLMQYIAPLREWFDDLLGDPGTVGGFASRWEGAESSLRRVVETLRDAEPRLAELDGRTVRALRARYGDLLSVAEDAAQWTGATASAVRLVSQIIESTRVLICDFLGRLSRFADDLFRFSLNPLQKLEDIQRFAESAAGFVTTAGALVKSLTGAVVSLAQLLYKLVPLVGDALATLRDVLADMLPLVGGLTGGPLGLVFGNVLHDFLTGDARVREIDPSTLNEDQLAAWNDAHEVTSLDSLSDLVSVNGTTDAMGGESSTAIDIKEVVGPDGSTHWVVSLPSTQAWEFGPSSGAMNDRDNNLALMLDNPLFRTQYERAVLDAMQQAGIPAGSDVVLTGFSQGGIMAANLAADSSFPYNPIGVVTNGSPRRQLPRAAERAGLRVPARDRRRADAGREPRRRSRATGPVPVRHPEQPGDRAPAEHPPDHAPGPGWGTRVRSTQQPEVCDVRGRVGSRLSRCQRRNGSLGPRRSRRHSGRSPGIPRSGTLI